MGLHATGALAAAGASPAQGGAPGGGPNEDAGRNRRAGTRRWTTAIVAAIGVLVLAQSAYRAVHQSIAHDEACTYNWFIAEPGKVFNYDPNNHVLATYLEMASVAAFGASELTLRLPTLCAALLYVVAVVVLMRLVMPSPVWAVPTAALLLLNPLVLDYLTQARGYGPALAFLLWGVDLTLMALLARPTGGVHARRWWLLASLALGLSVASSLPFLVVAGCLAATIAALWWASSRREAAIDRRPSPPVWVSVPAAAVLLFAYLPLVVKVLVSHAAARWPRLALRLASAGALAPTPRFPGALPQPEPWLVVGVSASLLLLLAAALAVGAWSVARRGAAARGPAGGSPPRRRRRALAWLALVVLVVAAASVRTVATRLAHRYLYVGQGTVSESLETWFEASVARDDNSSQEPFLPPTRWPAAVAATLVATAAATLGALLLIAVRLLREVRRAGLARLGPPRVAALLLAGTMSAAAVIYTAAHLVVGLHYPPPRAAVYVPPLTSAAFALALYGWRRRPRAVAALAAAVALAVLARYVQQWRPDRFWGDTWNANSRAAFEHLATLARGRNEPPARVGGLWVFEPAMNFYRATRHASWMAPYERVPAPDPDDYDYFLCDATRAAPLQRQGWRVAYRDPIGGLRLLERAPRR